MLSTKQSACRMGIIGRWSPESHLFGLESSASNVVLNRKSFDCCDGDGIVVDSANFKGAHLCGLTRRWSLYTRIISQWSELGNSDGLTLFGQPSASATALEKSAFKASVSCLEFFFKSELDGLRRSDKGTIVNFGALKTRLKSALKPHESVETIQLMCSKLAWLASAALTWHFEICVLPYRLGAARNAHGHQTAGLIVPPTSAWRDAIEKNASARKVMLIDGVSELWNPNRLESIELCVAFASEHKIPIWIFDGDLNAKDIPDENLAGASRTFRASVSRKLADARAKPSMNWLSGQGLSRLNEICNYLPNSKPQEIPDIV